MAQRAQVFRGNNVWEYGPRIQRGNSSKHQQQRQQKKIIYVKVIVLLPSENISESNMENTWWKRCFSLDDKFCFFLCCFANYVAHKCFSYIWIYCRERCEQASKRAREWAYTMRSVVCVCIVVKTKNELENYLNHALTFWDQKFGLKLKHIKAKCVLSFPLANAVLSFPLSLSLSLS